MRNKWIAGVAGSLLILPLAASASVNLVNDPSFEQQVASGPYQTFNAGDTMGGWSVTAGSVDLVGSYWQAPDGAQSVDVAGFYQNGTIQQTIGGITAGSFYNLTFEMSGNPDGAPAIKTVRVSFGNTSQDFTFDTTGISHENMGWQLRSGLFQANGSSDVLSFMDISGGVNSGTAFGAAIDQVSLTAVPEPTTVIAGMLLLLPFGASTVRILRAKRVA